MQLKTLLDRILPCDIHPNVIRKISSRRTKLFSAGDLSCFIVIAGLPSDTDLIDTILLIISRLENKGGSRTAFILYYFEFRPMSPNPTLLILR